MMPYSPESFEPLTFFGAVPQFRDGRNSPRAYLEHCLEVIAEREPVVKAWVVLNASGARKAADMSTARHRSGRPLSPIDGMPVGVKDLIETKDMPTEHGCAAFAGNHPRRDSALVRALRDAGALILGKTVTTEMGGAFPGPTTNPFDPTRTPGGSSSGSAAAIGARMVPAAIGTQVGGSVIRPASYCGNCALKPTMGALHRGERQGYSQSHVGVHAGSLVDMWHVAIEIARRAGGDPGQPGLYGAPELSPPLRPARLMVMETAGWAGLDGKTREGFDHILAALRDAGVEVLRRGDDPLIEAFERGIADAQAMTTDICDWENRWSFENLVEQYPGKYSDTLFARLVAGRKLSLDDYRLRLLQREEAKSRLAAIAPLADALITLASPGPAPRGLASTGDSVFNTPTSILGAPAVTVPMLAIDGMPVGIQIVGQRHADARTAGIARWLLETVRPIAVG
jgi:Asp-tRNA(Asn)/Glu-tRNA(Gln) amidotransferase A subunit family amidase